ncbi:MAG: hypothetical protein ACHQHO_11040 [Solirubrobacterales bacterium]
MISTRYSDFVQRVRRHRTSELLIALAATSIRLFEQEAWMADRARLPWAIAAAAKASIVVGNEHRSAGVTDRDVLEICAAYNALDTPLANVPAGVADTVGALLVRTSYEQFPYQQSHFEEISRLGALFENVEELPTEILDLALIERVLGCPLEEFVVAGFVLAISAQANAGFFDPDWRALREGPNSIDRHFPIDTVRRVFEQQFLASFEQIRADAKRFEQPNPLLSHHEFNPLVSRPFVTLPDGRHIAPQPHFVFQRLSSSALYYAAIVELNAEQTEAFTRDVGRVCEDYVGRQLRLIPNATVTPEIVYDDEKRSVDWFVVFDELVVLVEVKSTRMSHLARMGADRLKDDVDRCLGKAYKQVSRTDGLLADGHAAFAEIPTDRPRLAIIVTLEPYWAANSPFIAEFLPESPIPTTVASVRALERLVDVLRTVGGPDPLTQVLDDPDRRTWNLENALPETEVPKNPILDAAWSRFPFPTGDT